MILARWSLTARFNHRDECMTLLRKWEVDVGQRIGWRPGAVRIATGLVGSGDTDVEFEVRMDSLSDLESAWADMRSVPYHAELMKQLEPLIVSGTSRWSVYRVQEVTESAT